MPVATTDKQIKIAVFNGKYKTGAPLLYELIKYPNVTLRLSLANGKPVHPFYFPILEAGTYIYSQDKAEEMIVDSDVVISFTASHAGLGHQLKLIEQAKAAGVKLFIPLEFGTDWEEAGKRDPKVAKQPLVSLRKEAIDKLEELGVPYLKVVNGLIPENILVDGQQHPYISEASSWNWKLTENKVKILGSGDVPATWTPINYLAAVIAKTLATVPLETLATQKILRVQGYTATQNEVLEKVKEATGKDLAVEYVSDEEVEGIRFELFAANDGQGVINYWTEWPAFIQTEIAKGHALLSPDADFVETDIPLPTWAEVIKGLPIEV